MRIEELNKIIDSITDDMGGGLKDWKSHRNIAVRLLTRPIGELCLIREKESRKQIILATTGKKLFFKSWEDHCLENSKEDWIEVSERTLDNWIWNYSVLERLKENGFKFDTLCIDYLKIRNVVDGLNILSWVTCRGAFKFSTKEDGKLNINNLEDKSDLCITYQFKLDGVLDREIWSEVRTLVLDKTTLKVKKITGNAVKNIEKLTELYKNTTTREMGEIKEVGYMLERIDINERMGCRLEIAEELKDYSEQLLMCNSSLLRTSETKKLKERLLNIIQLWDMKDIKLTKINKNLQVLFGSSKEQNIVLPYTGVEDYNLEFPRVDRDELVSKFLLVKDFIELKDRKSVTIKNKKKNILYELSLVEIDENKTIAGVDKYTGLVYFIQDYNLLKNKMSDEDAKIKRTRRLYFE